MTSLLILNVLRSWLGDSPQGKSHGFLLHLLFFLNLLDMSILTWLPHPQKKYVKSLKMIPHPPPTNSFLLNNFQSQKGKDRLQSTIFRGSCILGSRFLSIHISVAPQTGLNQNTGHTKCGARSRFYVYIKSISIQTSSSISLSSQPNVNFEYYWLQPNMLHLISPHVPRRWSP